MDRLHFHLLGEARVLRVGTQQPRGISIRPAGWPLLAYLLLFRERAHSRERLIDLFWKGYDEKQARHCLRTTLWRLRQALKPDRCITTRAKGQLQFDNTQPCWLDVAMFEAEITQGLDTPLASMTPIEAECLEKAHRLYAGDLLPMLYDDWVLRERERLRLLYQKGLERLMTYYRNRQQYEAALACGQQILELNPLREGIHQRMISLYLARGQRAQAVAQYNQCEAVLAEELQLTPMAETQQLLAEALSTLSQSMTHSSEPATLSRAVQQLSQAAQGLEQIASKLRLVAGLVTQHIQQEGSEITRKR